MNSIQGARYIKRRMGNDLKQKILSYNGIAPPDEMKKKPSVLECPRCELVNAKENKYCSKCSYPLTVQAYEEIKNEEHAIKRNESEIQILKENFNKQILNLRNEIMKEVKSQMAELVTRIKPEIIKEGMSPIH